MTRPIKAIVDCTTNTTSLVEYTDEEMVQLEKDAIEYQKYKTEQEEKAQATAEAKASAEAKLAALGLTAAEIAAL
jgi:hypothetical protein